MNAKIENAKSLRALNAACKGKMVFRAPNNFEFEVDAYGKPAKYVLDNGEWQARRKFNSLADAAYWAANNIDSLE
jgi:hypothetical protein